jgi:integrase
MEPFRAERAGRYRPVIPRRVPRRIPDEQFNELFGGLKYNRDRALLAFWVSTGARAEELLGACQGDADPGEQLIAVTRKGSRAVQRVPASPDAFVWLRLCQEEAWRAGAACGRAEPLWFTLRRPWRPLAYHAARAMFIRANELLGSDWTIHDLRHRSLADGPGPGDAEGLRVSLAAARDKLAQLDERNRRASTVNLGIPAFRDIVGRIATLPRERP